MRHVKPPEVRRREAKRDLAAFPEPASSRVRLLLVDNSDACVALLLDELRSGGLEPEIERVETREAFATAVAERSWDIVLANVVLSGFSGMAALEIMRERGLDIPLVLVCSRAQRAAATQGMRLGARDYIVKENLSRLVPAVLREMQGAADRRRSNAAIEALRLTQQRYELLLEETIQGVCVMSENKVRFANPQFAHLFGYGTVQDVLSLDSAMDLIVPEDRNQILGMRIGNRKKEEGPLRFEVRGLHHSGARMSLDVSAVSVRWEGRRANLISVVDISERKRAEAALRDSEQRFHAFMDAGPALKWIHDEEGRYVFASTQVEQVMGVKREEWLGKRVADVLPAALASRADEIRREILRTGLTSDNVEETVSVSGALTAWRTVRFPFLDSSGRRYTGGICFDITEQRSAEREMVTSRRLLQSVFDTIPHAVSVKDTQARYLMVNKTWCQRYGLTPEEAIGKTAIEVKRLDKDYARHYLAHDKRALAGEEFTVLEGTERIVEGQRRDFHTIKSPIRDIQGSVTGIVGVTVDLTDLKDAQSKESVATARLSNAIESLPGAFLLYDKNERLVVWNSQVSKFYPELSKVLRPGVTYEQIARATIPYLRNADEDVERWIQGRLAEFRTGQVTFALQRSDGRWLRGIDRRTTDGGTVSLRFDITEVKRRDEQLAQMQKIEALNVLTGGVAHDFNNSLHLISGFIELALQEFSPDHPARRRLESAEEAAKRAAALTRQLLAISHQQFLEPQEVDLRDVVRSVSRRIGNSIHSTVEIAVKEQTGVQPVMADRASIEQVIVNLALNARDALPHGGKIEVETGSAVLDEAFCFDNPWARPGRYSTLRFSDTGIGMTEEVRTHIFEPFFSTKPVGTGAGLGLSTVHGIVKQHGGLIRVESSPGFGSTFWIYLPVMGQNRLEIGPPKAQSAPGGSEIVLIAQSDPNRRELLIQALHGAGYAVIPVGDGLEAYSAFSRRPAEIALAIVDLTMPGLSGFESFLKMRELRPQVRALFSSGWFTEKEMNFIREYDQGFLYRPHSADQLLRAVRATLDRRLDSLPSVSAFRSSRQPES